MVPIASGLGSGYSPFAPGTAGSFVAMLLYLGIVYTLGPWWVLPVTIILFPVSVWASDWGEKYYKMKDPRFVTIDEFAGYFVTMLFLPANLQTAVIGFFVFRLFDILKLYPGRRLEDLKGGWGITLDDIAAGVYGNILIRLFFLFYG